MDSNSKDLQPERLTRDEDGGLLIDWPDGHQTALSARELRLGCPCAMCREERESSGRTRVEDAGSPSRFQIRRLDPVGRYAVSIGWGDGHNTGIYSWTVLRDLCSCFECRMQRGEA